MKRRVAGGVNLFLSAVAVTGSFILSLEGNTPCVFCWIARISMIGILIFSILEIVKSYDVFFIFTAFLSLIAMSSAGYLIYLDFRPQSICVAKETCYSPLFMGIPASVYAFLLSTGVLICSLSAIIFLRRNEV